MTNIHAAIVDDQKTALDLISGSIVTYSKVLDANVILDKYCSPDAFLNGANLSSLDLVFLDIDMPFMSGIELGTKIKAANSAIDIIFVSDYEGKVFDSFAAQPFGFVRKSAFLKDVESMMKMYVSYFKKKKNDFIDVKHDGEIERININEIAFLESFGNIQRIHLVGKDPIESRDTMKSLESTLCNSGFMRIHHSYLVNFYHIKGMSHQEVKMDTGDILPISRGKKKEVFEKFMALTRDDELIVN